MTTRLLVWVLAVVVAVGASPPQVTLPQGTLQGSYALSAQGARFASFEGVPYAAPPVGERRFQEPGPAEPWSGVLNASKPGSPCLQYANVLGQGIERVRGAEDCLFLNVFTTRLNPKAAMDVVVFIHGGAFMYGGGHVPRPNYLMDYGVVLVTLNYRLGALGFLSTGDEVVPGNNGLKDQVAALRWVQQNIASFGGNPDSVTIAGLSAGGASVHYHFLSPLSRGLFHRGISLSGCALSGWAQADALPFKSVQLASLVGCPTSPSKRLVECLKKRPARDIVSQTAQFQVWMYNPFSPWAPSVEVAGPSAFLAEKPEAALRAGRVAQLPWLVGVTSEEGLYPAGEFVNDDKLLKELDEDWDAVIPHLLDFNYTVEQSEQLYVPRAIKRYYLGSRGVSRDTTQQIIQMIGDRHFVVDLERAARIQASVVKTPVYFYRFSYRGQHSFSDAMTRTNDNYGACHGDDLAYVMQAPFTDSQGTPQDRAMSLLLLKAWTSFLRTGTPVAGDTGVVWEPVTPGGKALNYLHLGSSTDVDMRTNPDLGHRRFWDSLPLNEHLPVGHFSDEL